MDLVTIPLDKIVKDDRYYPRIKPSWFRELEYADAMRTGAEFPPVLVARDGDGWILIDGWHRILASRRCGRETIRCEVTRAPRDRWLEISVQRNAINGHRMSVQDKVRVIDLLHRAGYSWARIGKVIYMPTSRVHQIAGGRVLPPAHSGAHPIYVKAVLKRTAAGMSPRAVEDAQELLAARDQIQILEGALILFEHEGALDLEDEDVVEMAHRLAGAVAVWERAHPAAQARAS